MNDLDRLLQAVLTQARALGLPVSSQIDPHVAVDRRAVCRLGCCILKNGRYQIHLSVRLSDGPEAACLQTLAHEALHTCPGCLDHGKRWQSYAARMNTAYGYAISRTSDPAALGLPDWEKPVRYVLVCRSCGREFARMRASSLVQHPERYRCRCGGRLARKS